MDDERDESADPPAEGGLPLAPNKPPVPETEEELERWAEKRPLEPSPPPDDAEER